MKLATLLFALISLAFLQPAFAQDRLLLSNGDEMQVRVLELSPDSVHFSSLADSASKKIASLPRTAVFSITYQNGKVDVMAAALPEKQRIPSEMELYERGRKDSQKNHKALGAYAGTVGATVVFGPLMALPAGLATGAVLGFTNVPEKNIKPSKPEFLQSPSYRAGYIQQAKKKKRTNAAAGFATGAGAWVALGIIAVLTFSDK